MASKAFRERVQAVAEFLKENEVEFKVEEGTKHPKMVLFFGQEQRKLTLSNSPSDQRSLKNFICDVRRLVNSMRGVSHDYDYDQTHDQGQKASCQHIAGSACLPSGSHQP